MNLLPNDYTKLEYKIIVWYTARTAFNSDKIPYMHILQALLILNSQGNVNIFEFRNDNTNLQHEFIDNFLLPWKSISDITVIYLGYLYVRDWYWRQLYLLSYSLYTFDESNFILENLCRIFLPQISASDNKVPKMKVIAIHAREGNIVILHKDPMGQPFYHI